MLFYTYILQSTSTSRLYIGQTNNLERRISQHNNNESKSTRNKGPWVMLHFVEFDNRSEAVQLETKLKNWKSSKRVLQYIARNKL